MMTTANFPKITTSFGIRKVVNNMAKGGKKFDGGGKAPSAGKASSGSKGMPPKASAKSTGTPKRCMY